MTTAAEALRDAATQLREMAAERMDARGVNDARGAAIWDCAAYVDTLVVLEDS